MSEAIIGALGLLIGGILTGIVSLNVARTNTRSAPYEQLAKRVEVLELADETKSVTIDRLRRGMRDVIDDRDGLVDYVQLVMAWVRSGGTPPPPPVPLHLRDRLSWNDDVLDRTDDEED